MSVQIKRRDSLSLSKIDRHETDHRAQASVPVSCTIALFLIFAALMGLLSVYVLGYDYVFGLIDLFDLNNENNVPTFFSALILLLCSLLLFVMANYRKTAGQPAGYWLGLALIFLFLSIDEDASIHEVLIVPLRTLLAVSGPFY